MEVLLLEHHYYLQENMDVLLLVLLVVIKIHLVLLEFLQNQKYLVVPLEILDQIILELVQLLLNVVNLQKLEILFY